MDAPDLGARLRTLRERRGLALRELARRTGIAVSFLSALERGRDNVAVATLKRILDALNVTLGAFFAGTAPPAAKVVWRRRELAEIAGKSHGVSFREVAAGRPGRALQLLVERYAPGGDTGPAVYRHAADEAGVVLRGKLELTLDGERHLLGPGDAFYFDARRPHRFRNAGRGAAEAVSVNSPPSL